MMRDAFEHDFFGHLSAFHLPVGGKPRWVRLGIIEPYGGGEGREPLVSHLGWRSMIGWSPSTTFDWFEHTHTLEAIEEPIADADYPRRLPQNKPRYRYCAPCKEQGKKTVATWICLEC